MNLKKQKRAALTLCGLLVLAACPNGAGTGTPEETRISFPVVDGLSGASLIRHDVKNFAYVDGDAGVFRLNKVNVSSFKDDNTAAVNRFDLMDNIKVSALNKDTWVYLTRGTDATPTDKKIVFVNYTTGKTLKTIGFETGKTPLETASKYEYLNNSEAGFVLTDDYLVAGYTDDEGDEREEATYISIYDARGTKPPTHTKTADGVGVLAALAVKGNYILAGGSNGTAVYKINPANFTLSLETIADGKASHWMKSNGTYVLETKDEAYTVKIWKWNGGSAPAVVGTISTIQNTVVPDGGTKAELVRALQFDPDDPGKAYMVSFTGGLVYKVNLATATRDAAPLFTFIYPEASFFYAWMIEKVTQGGNTYFIISGGYGDNRKKPKEATGAALVFKNPVSSGMVQPDTVEVYSNPNLVRSLRVLKDTAGNAYYIAKDNEKEKMAFKKLN